MFSLREGNFGMRIDDESLLIQLYIDDIGLTNPIGPKKDRHKMTMVYFLLEDMPDKHRSQLQSINLLAICPSDSVKVREIFWFISLCSLSFDRKDPRKSKRFFQPIIDDLNALQEHGLSIGGRRVSLSFSTLCADKLAAYQVGGFQASFSSNHFCRRCYILFNDRALPLSPSKTVWRTSVEHDHHLQTIHTDPQPGDCMHDFVEGSCPLVVMALLKEASASRLITYGERGAASCAVFHELCVHFQLVCANA